MWDNRVSRRNVHLPLCKELADVSWAKDRLPDWLWIESKAVWTSTIEGALRRWWALDSAWCAKDQPRRAFLWVEGRPRSRDPQSNSEHVEQALEQCWVHARDELHRRESLFPLRWCASLRISCSSLERLPSERVSHDQVAWAILPLWDHQGAIEARNADFNGAFWR